MNIAVITSFSEAGFHQYGKRMLETFDRNWPKDVRLYAYPDSRVDAPASSRIECLYPEISERTALFERWRGTPGASGETPAGYDYRFDLFKFSHKPFVIRHFMQEVWPTLTPAPEWLIWMDADTVTHAQMPRDVLTKKICNQADVTYLGRPWKYSECGFMVFRLPKARLFMEHMIRFYTEDLWHSQKEWHDSFLFDRTRDQFLAMRPPPLTFVSLSAHLTRKGGGSHPLVNTFLGTYLDHLKGPRKLTGKPRPADMRTNNPAPYWKNQP